MTPYGVLIEALNGNKTMAEKCIMALLDYALDLEYGNNQEPVIRFLEGVEWDIYSSWDHDGSLM